MVPLLLMKHRWKLFIFVRDNKSELVIFKVSKNVTGRYEEYCDHLFDDKDMKMLRWLLEETVNEKAVIRNKQVTYTQDRLGDIVWNKLGER